VRFALTEAQAELKEGFAEFLADAYPVERVRELWESKTGRDPQLWAQLAELGAVGLTVADADGGLGLGEVELLSLLEEAGYALLAEPLVSTTAVAAPLLADLDAGEEWQQRIAAGEAIVAVGLEPSGLVLDAHVADLIVLRDGDDAYALGPDEITLVEQTSIDRSRRLFSVGWDRANAEFLSADAAAALDAAYDRGALAVSAELLGITRRLIDGAVEYSRLREQFGQPIGAFQAVKHMLTDSLLNLEFALPVVYRAALSAASGDPLRSRDVSMAKAAASEAAKQAARVALQIHGAIGYTWEHDLHFWLMRAESLRRAWGDAAWHRERVGGYVLGAPGGEHRRP
jgi:alkylation response protein AidB-like acyl-CoA dehydrogenase